MKMAVSFCRQYRDQLSDRCLNWFPCLSDPGRRSSICLKVALVMIHLIYLGVLLIADTDNLIQTAKKNPWYIGLYLLLFVATLIQYFVTSGSSPGYVIDAMRAANEGYSSRVPRINSKQPATSNNGNIVIPVDANIMGRSFLGSNAPPWTQLVMEMYPPGTSTRQLTCSYCNVLQEDIKLLKEMGMDSYRFSIAWPRILPKGSEENGPINQEGIDFYNKFIDALIAEGIEPVVTLFHFDLPAALQDKYHGFMNSQIVEDFKKYADICFANFGDRVKFWSTINEPYVFASFGYNQGLPDKKSDLGPFVATHNIILAHAAAAQIYHDKYQQKQKGKIGISLPCQWFEPHSTNPTDAAAARIQLDFMLGWYMDPFVSGDYPESMKDSIRELPKFTKEQRKMLKNSCDFIGINYYTARFGKQTTTVDLMKGTIDIKYTSEIVNADGTLIGEEAQGQKGIHVNPVGLRNLLLYITEKYDKPELYVTENGFPEKPKITDSVLNSIKKGNIGELKAALFDDKRVSHVEDHLTAIREARKKGANVRGFFVWTLMDNMEVGAGYDARFGLNFTDYYDNLKRYPKKSAKWFTNFLATPPKKN